MCVFRQCSGEVPGSESGRRAVWRVAGTQEWLSVLLSEVCFSLTWICSENSAHHWWSLFSDRWVLAIIRLSVFFPLRYFWCAFTSCAGIMAWKPLKILWRRKGSLTTFFLRRPVWQIQVTHLLYVLFYLLRACHYKCWLYNQCMLV